ncbi:alpha/beta fold hydrolase [Litoreibacter halocynthiae]|uniref:alpha/beta fold hydrolase n=1 Tax=Litoreibacter halocynthiae TaxID=1242689 RepID=UPI002490C1E4|nr:alpha/beta fold hydrolase [Litoreibacter halocynthiae]
MPEPLVFLPGMMCDGRLYGPQIKALGRDRAIHLAPICAHETVEALATEVLASAPPTFALAGLSMGGIVAMEVVRRAPTRVTRLALMDTNALAETPAYAAAREPQIARVMAGSLVEVMREEMKPDYLAPGAGRQAVLDLVMDMALEMGEGVFLRQSRALQRRPDQQNVLRKLKIPTLILCGEHDRLCPVARHQFMADLIFRATLVVVPDAGHLPTLEQPEAVNAALKQWLAA